MAAVSLADCPVSIPSISRAVEASAFELTEIDHNES